MYIVPRCFVSGNTNFFSTILERKAVLEARGFKPKFLIKRFIFEQLPEYRLSNFQQALPAAYSLEMLGDYLLDIPGTVRFLQQVIWVRE